jgi:hypothetical protein
LELTAAAVAGSRRVGGFPRYTIVQLIKEMSAKNVQMRTDSFFKPSPLLSAATSTDPGSSCSMPPGPDL